VSTRYRLDESGTATNLFFQKSDILLHQGPDVRVNVKEKGVGVHLIGRLGVAKIPVRWNASHEMAQVAWRENINAVYLFLLFICHTRLNVSDMVYGGIIKLKRVGPEHLDLRYGWSGFRLVRL
jgi:hypothetical protein